MPLLSRANANDHNGLILAPSQQFIASLALGNIAEGKGFKPLDTEASIAYWQQSLQQSKILADEFAVEQL